MRAVVLVGGFGTRLRPLTDDRPMIERVVVKLGAVGVTDAILSLGYRPDAFFDAYPDDTLGGVKLHYAVEPEPLDTAGAIRFAAIEAGIDSRFIVVNGDVLTDLDVAALWAAHTDRGAEGTIALTPVDDPSRYGVVPLAADGRVEAFIEKPPPDEAPSNWINAGTYVLEPSVVERIPAGRRVSIEREIFPAMVTDEALFGVQSDAYWVDAGTPDAYLRSQLDLVDGTRANEPAVAATADVSGEATVDHSIVMAGVTVAAGAEVRDSALLPGAVVEAGAVVKGSIVGPGSVIGRGATLADLTVTGRDTTVEPGTTLSGARIPESED